MKRIFPLITLALLGGCAYPGAVIPPDVDKTINYDVGYAQLKAQPDQYIGTTVLLGGEIQSLKNLEHGTEVEVLQMPLDDYGRPIDRYASQGRFYFMSDQFLDKAVFGQGSRLTVACKVSGTKSHRFDQTEVRFPSCVSQYIYLWPPRSEGAYDYDPYPGYVYPPYGYWSLYWGWPYYYGYYGFRSAPAFRGRVFHR